MTNIDELLVAFGTATFKRAQGQATIDDIRSARAAVDAEIKRLQDRIAELEAAQEFFQYDEKAR